MSQEQNDSASVEAPDYTTQVDQGGGSPTSEVYAELERAYSFFNDELFDGRLPACMITLQRANDSLGYFSPNQFVKSQHKGVLSHEIALNPSYFAIRSIPETLSILVREMVSLDQYLHSEKLPRGRYRNKEWADMAEAVGIMPSTTGLPGGKRTGENILVYIIDGGPFDVACSTLIDEQFVLSWLDRHPPANDKSKPAPATEIDLATPSVVADGGDNADLHPVGLSMASDLDTEGESEIEGSWDASILTAGADSDDDADEHAVEGKAGAGEAPPAPPMKTFAPVDVDALAESGIEPREKPKNSSKSKFNCKVCNANVWGRPSLLVACEGTDDEQHESERMVLIG